MPVRASRRAGVDVPYDVMAAIASDPAAFDAKVQDWVARKRAAVEAEAAADKAVAAAKAGQDTLDKEITAFSAFVTAETAKLASDRAEFEKLAKAENDRLLKMDGELGSREHIISVREKAIDDREVTVNKAFNEAVTMKQAADQAKRLAETNSGIVAGLRATLEAKHEKLRQIVAELLA